MAARPTVLLASASPRRLELLREILPAETIFVIASHHEEHAEPGETAAERVRRLAREKAEVVAAMEYPPTIRVILGADTEVVVDGESLGKPATAEEARDMLRRLAGRDHEVITGIALMRPGADDATVDCVSTTVRFRHLSGQDIDEYVASGEPMDKAGAYAIQGGAAAFVTAVEGSYTNVVGLPLEYVGENLPRFGITVRRR